MPESEQENGTSPEDMNQELSRVNLFHVLYFGTHTSMVSDLIV